MSFVVKVRDAELVPAEDGTASRELHSAGGVDRGIWEIGPGVATDVEADEMFVVIEGRATIEIEGGPTLEVGPGDVCVFDKGARTTWHVHERLRKVYQITR
ncbi:cupin domain-containing protein [Actinocorallia sp. A-T 12471]|uniref:cupin domain-containing protein n=1 Tax=Actinocorallia sp. A-T 12471 TaxID=3089813 RepID=UPI0029D2B36C|nr:cupin domain-containing protein [Actinocorallia sp. A-T 12471]MDX6739163.1 cupin domain-containing protein [Actinocorallia sp. A-T 12471]